MKVRIKAGNGYYLMNRGSAGGKVLLGREAGEFWLVAATPDPPAPPVPPALATLRTGAVVNIRTNPKTERPGRLDPVVTNHGVRGYTDRLIVVTTEYNSWGGVGLRQSDDHLGFFEVHSLSAGSGPLQDGDRVAFRCLDGPGRPFPATGAGKGWWSVVGDEVQLVEKPAPGAAETFTLEGRKELKLYWSVRLGDNLSTADGEGETAARGAGYQFIRVQGHMYVGPGAGRVALKRYWHEGRGDSYLTATEEGEQDAIAAGYVLRQVQGYILEHPAHGTVPMKVYWSPARQDHINAVLVGEERDAADAGYEFVRIEGHVFPAAEPRSMAAPAEAVADAVDGALADALPGPSGAEAERAAEARLPGPAAAVPVWPVQPGDGIGGGVRPVPGTLRPRWERRRRRGGRNGTGLKALVLSGGGAKGCFEVGAVQRLIEGGYRPDIICGVSVGALNAVKLAEGNDAHTELEPIWHEINAPGRPGGVFQPMFFLEAVAKWILANADGTIVTNTGVFLSQVTYIAAHLHALHSMAPLRRMIREHINVTALRNSDIMLRVGMVDLESGQFFSVAQPEFVGDLERFGRIEVEPDHRVGETWLTRPIYGASSYLMDIEDAVYSSCVQPVFMDPKVANLRLSQHRNVGGQRFATLPVYHPPAIQRILDLFDRNPNPSGKELDDALSHLMSDEPKWGHNQLTRESGDAWRGDMRSYHRHLFDGGLRDTIPIRTAMRLGAREITVITGDRVQQAAWRFADPGKVRTGPGGLEDTSIGNVPLAQYFLGLLNVWFNETARSDMMLAVAHNEFLGWLYRCFALLDADKRQQIVREFNQYWRSHGDTMRAALGASSWLGGSTGFQVSEAGPDYAHTRTEAEIGPYGIPFHDEGCKITYIAPDRDLLGPLDFTNKEGIAEGIALGRLAADRPFELSYPVPESAIVFAER